MAKFIKFTLAVAITALIVKAIVHHWAGLMVGLGVEGGTPSTSPGPDPTYNWWSGSGSVFIPPIITLMGLGLGFYWHHLCHEQGCYRYGRLKRTEGDHVVPVCHRCKRKYQVNTNT